MSLKPLQVFSCRPQSSYRGFEAWLKSTSAVVLNGAGLVKTSEYTYLFHVQVKFLRSETKTLESGRILCNLSQVFPRHFVSKIVFPSLKIGGKSSHIQRASSSEHHSFMYDQTPAFRHGVCRAFLGNGKGIKFLPAGVSI